MSLSLLNPDQLPTKLVPFLLASQAITGFGAPPDANEHDDDKTEKQGDNIIRFGFGLVACLVEVFALVLVLGLASS